MVAPVTHEDLTRETSEAMKHNPEYEWGIASAIVENLVEAGTPKPKALKLATKLMFSLYGRNIMQNKNYKVAIASEDYIS